MIRQIGIIMAAIDHESVSKQGELKMKDKITAYLKKITLEDQVKYFYFLYLIMTLCSYFWMYSMLTVPCHEYIANILRTTGLVFIGVKLCVDKVWEDKTELSLAMVLVFAGVLNFMLFRQHIYDFDMILLVIGAYRIKFKDILKVWLSVSVILIILMTVFSQTGVIEDLVYYQADHNMKPRHAFGSNYPTDYAAGIAFCAMGVAWLRGKKAGLIDALVDFVLAAFVWNYCAATNSAGILLLLGLGILYFDIRKKLSKDGRYHMMTGTMYILEYAMPIGVVLLFTLSIVYINGGDLIEKINLMLHQRLATSSAGLMKYPLNLFGNAVQLRGFGGTTEMPDYVFMLDDSYVNVALRQGVVMLACIVLLFFRLGKKQAAAGEWSRLFILALVAVHCFFEHHLWDIIYNPFTLAFFAMGDEIRADED